MKHTDDRQRVVRRDAGRLGIASFGALQRVVCIGILAALAVACSTTQSRYSSLGKIYPAKPATAEIEVFQTGLPPQPFERIARLDVHLEKTHFVSSSLENALPELKRQARLAGADGIIEIEEKRSMVGETKIYHVTATGVRYTGSAGQ